MDKTERAELVMLRQELMLARDEIARLEAALSWDGRRGDWIYLHAAEWEGVQDEGRRVVRWERRIG